MSGTSIADQLEVWRRDLIDFSRRNRLLNLNSRATSLQLVEPLAKEIVDILLEGKRVRIHPELSSIADSEVGTVDTHENVSQGEIDVNEPVILKPNEVRTAPTNWPKLATTIRTLKRRSDQEFLDKGIRILYLAVGTLNWFEDNDAWSSPILLFPIELYRVTDGVFDFMLNSEEDTVFNPALIEKLREDMGIDLEIALTEESPMDAISQTAKAIKSHKKWTIDETATIGIFSFAKEVIFRDLKTNGELAGQSDLVRALAFGADSGVQLGFDRVPEDQLDLFLPPTKLNSILDADATQRQAVIAAKAGKSFVIDGPPGTGKSQTIANVIAELIGDGKSILFVSEKAAALEVVQRRLERSGLGSFLLPLHSQKVTRKEFAGLLMRAITERAKAGAPLSLTQLTRLETNQRQLSAYVAAMNEVRSPLGKSLFTAIGEHAQLASFPDAPIPLKAVDHELTPSRYLEIEDFANSLSRSWRQIEDPIGFIWRGLIDASTSLNQRSQLVAALSGAEEAVSEMVKIAEEMGEESGIPEPETVAQLSALTLLHSKMEIRPVIPIHWLTSEDLPFIQDAVRDALEKLAKIQELRSANVKLFPGWIDLSLRECHELVELATETSLMSTIEEAALQSTEAFEALVEELGGAIEDLMLGIAAARTLEPMFGEDKKKLSIKRIRLVATIAGLSRSESLPEESWFLENMSTKVEDALRFLQPALNEYWDHVREVERLFTEEIRNFPIENLFNGNSTRPNLGLLSSQGRQNRKELAKLSRSGKISEDEKRLLTRVKDLVECGRRIDEPNPMTAVLGTFFRGTSTDTQAVRTALEVVKTARTVMKKALPESMAMAFARNGSSTEWTIKASRQLDQMLLSLDALTMKFNQGSISDDSSATEVLEHLQLLAGLWARVQRILGSSFSKAKVTIEDCLILADNRIQYSSLQEEVLHSESGYIELLGSLYKRDDTDVAVASAALEWTIAVRAALSVPPSVHLANRILEAGIRVDGRLPVKLHDLQKALDYISLHFLDSRWQELQPDLLGDIQSASTLMRKMVEGIEQIDETIAFNSALKFFSDQGLSEVVDYLVNSRVSHLEVTPVVMKAVLAAWIESTLASDAKRLSPLDKKSRDDAVRDFAAIDRKMKDHAASRVAEVGNGRRPVAAIGAVGIIQKEAQKKSRHMRIIDLLSRTEDVALSTKPCFMMSPLSVSSFLPPTIRFDVVIFDEASQMLTSNAINAVYRGRQLIIAGDERQLPPTSFFDRGLEEDDSDEYIEDGIEKFESVLHQAKSGGFEQVGLRWHYRSRHESLITYSNYSFYKGELVTYPSAIQESSDLGVNFVHVPNGVYKRSGSRSNTIEAQKVVERVLFFADHHPELSAGVVAFSTAQADEIENQLEVALEARPDLREYFNGDRLNGFFVKNLESVQGDERDVIIFSVGYGKDEHGKLTMNFGPVNQEGGWRRLNVAFTRARNRIELVASIRPGDITGTTNPNVNHLKRYFDYAERGVAALAMEVKTQGGGPESPFEEAVIQTVNSWGYDVEPQVGQAGFRIDMAVKDPKHPGAYILGIECDGAAYHSSKVARDRDRLRQEVLEGLGWNLYRIWGPTWYRSRANAEAELRHAIEAALSNSQNPLLKPKVKVAPIVRHETIEVEFADLSQFVQPYFKAPRPAAPRLMIDAYGNITSSAISEFILEVVAQEGPVSSAIVKRRFANAAGMWLRANVQQALDQNIRTLVESKKLLSLKHSCLVLPNQDRFVARKPDPDDELTKRDAKNIAVTEIAAAAANFVSIARAIDITELEQLVVRNVFGWDRVTQAWRDAILEAIELFATRQWWTYEGNIVKIGKDFPS